MISGFGNMEVRVLGVENGANPADTDSAATLTELTVDEDIYDDGLISLELDGYEIAQIVIDDPEWTTEFMAAMGLNTPEYVDDFEAEQDMEIISYFISLHPDTGRRDIINGGIEVVELDVVESIPEQALQEREEIFPEWLGTSDQIFPHARL